MKGGLFSSVLVNIERLKIELVKKKKKVKFRIWNKKNGWISYSTAWQKKFEGEEINQSNGQQPHQDQMIPGCKIDS